jgi:hypothetical protein
MKPAIVMKVGVHAGEAWDSIVSRRQAEERIAGVTFWGYGGSVCHPITQVRPFVEQVGETVEVLMIRTPSDFMGVASPAREMSIDGVRWEPLPEGIWVTGSKYALVIRSLRPSDGLVDLGAYEVGIGRMTGLPLSDYLRSRVDKACARPTPVPTSPRLLPLVLRAELAVPYAVLLRS